MITHIYRIILIIFLTFICYFFNYLPNDHIFSTLFTISSIFFSIGISLIITFDLSKISSDKFYFMIKNNINYVRNMFLIYFLIISISYFLGLYHFDNYQSTILYNKMILNSINISNITIQLAFSILVVGILFFIVNFVTLQKLKNDIDSRIRLREQDIPHQVGDSKDSLSL